MSCERCADLCMLHPVQSPEDLRRLIGMAQAHIESGILKEVPHPDVPYWDEKEFPDVAAGGPWNDIVGFRFVCVACGEIFELAAETYHGMGGTWRPIDEDSIREAS
jgi:hypothetical protein